ncbi:MAG: LD-carboxypeptidase [Clostridia bacterium]|nr:LD-carboxypeptidase [Clostridia bacterium]MBQ6122080.1 LD-carboxypeptidase [Clostridia bacterium]
MIKPKPLRRGDTIGLVGISGALHEPETRFEKMLEAIDALGYKVIVADSCREEYGYLSGTDASRAKGLNQMFRDDRVDAVVCMRGGYGVTRILDRVDFDVIRANPKLLLGYSDITALHTAIHEKVGMVTIHGPMPDRAWMEFDDFSRRSMLRALTSTEPLGTLYNPEGTAPKCVVPGRCEGRLVGGNLSLIAALCGTPYQLNPEGKVLLLEDVGEYVYRLDSMLTQLRLAGMFERCAGVVLGGFTNCTEEYERYALHLEDVIRDIIVPAGKPVLANLSIGHTPVKITVPLGVNCAVDAEAGTLTITEAALED